jgi:ABC-type multidrug transport system ATPase subunit
MTPNAVSAGVTGSSSAGAPASRETAVGLRGVSRLFGSHPALAAVDLQVPAGASVLLHGENGAGKSTLLAVIATLMPPTFGSGQVLGLDLRTDRRAIRRRTELVGHRNRLYLDLTPREHLELVVALGGVAGGVDDALDTFDLGRIASSRIRDLSQGQRHRVALARAVLRRPDLLLLDEPYGALDGASREAVDALITSARARGATVLMATHDIDRAAPFVDRRVELAAGRVVREVAP